MIVYPKKNEIQTNVEYKTRYGKTVILEEFHTLSSGRVYRTSDRHDRRLYMADGTSLHNDHENDIIIEQGE